MYKKSKEFYDFFKDEINYFKDEKYHFYVSVVKGFKLKPLIIDKFQDADEFANGCVASGLNINLITIKLLVNK